MAAVVYEGTWDQLMTHSEELKIYGNLTLIAHTPLKIEHKFKSPQDRIAAMEAFAETNRNLPILPDSAWDRDSIYD